jgi:NAD(P)-dependent dehydrogenase (short-subunit alcohol dehydrogenase family)
MALDLASFASIEEFSAAFTQRCSELHVLVANAGLVLGDRRRTCEGFEMTFGVNHLGHFLLTEALLPLLRAGAPARIVVVASEAHRRRGGLDFDDLQSQRRYDGFAVYCRSKLANIYFTRELARRLSDEGITVNAVHPGVVASGLGRDGDVKGMFGWLIRRAAPFLLSEARGAETSVYVATAPELEGRTGGYFAKCRPIEPSKEALDDASARRLWQVSEQLVSNRWALPGVPNAPTLDDA